MIPYQADGRKPVFSLPNLPPELAALPRWACWRPRERPYKGGTRTVYEALHPQTGRELAVSAPGGWVGYEQACRPEGRKPFGGVGLLVCGRDGLAVVRHAGRSLAAGLDSSVLYISQEVNGDGCALVVGPDVHGARTDLFLPLSGHDPCASPALFVHAGPQFVQDPCGITKAFSPETSPRPDADRLSGHLIALAGDFKPLSQGSGTVDPGLHLPSLVSLLKAAGLSASDATPGLLREYSRVIEEDAGKVSLRVSWAWPLWRTCDIRLEDALLAVRVNPSLLEGFDLFGRKAPLVAGMARWLGHEGDPFTLHQATLARVVGLSAQDAASNLLAVLRQKGVIVRVAEADHRARVSATYAYTGPGACAPVRRPLRHNN